QGAVEALRQTFAGRARAFRVGVQEDGRVVVTGAGPSPEVQLAVCQCLRRLPRCACVLNQMPAARADGLADQGHRPEPLVLVPAAPEPPAVWTVPAVMTVPQLAGSPANPEAPPATSSEVVMTKVPATPARSTNLKASPAQLKESIEGICGGAVQNVRVNL